MRDHNYVMIANVTSDHNGVCCTARTKLGISLPRNTGRHIEQINIIPSASNNWKQLRCIRGETPSNMYRRGTSMSTGP